MMTVAAAVLLLSGYVSAWLVMSRARLNPALEQKVRPVFAPLIGYCNLELPGSGLLIDLGWRINPPVWMETTPDLDANGGYKFKMVVIRPAFSPPPPKGIKPTLTGSSVPLPRGFAE
jgi:hypothetical protein